MRTAVDLLRGFAGRAVSAGGVLAISIILSRQLDLAEASEFFVGFTVVMGLAILARMGQDLRLLRRVAKIEAWPAKLDELSRALWIVIAAAAFISVCSVVVNQMGVEGPLGEIWLVIIPTTLINIVSSYFKGTNSPGLGSLSEVGIISLVASLVYLACPQDEAIEAWHLFATAAWIVAGAWLAVAMKLSLPTAQAPRKAIEAIRDARHLWMVAVLSYVAQWIAILPIMLLLDEGAVAQLNALLRMLAPLQFIILTVDYLLAPRFANSEGGDLRDIRRWGIAAGLVLALPYAAIMIIMPEWTMQTLFGEAYADLSAELRILVAGTLFQIALGNNGMLLNMVGNDVPLSKSVVLRLLVSCFFLIPLLFVQALVIVCVAYAIAIVIQAIYLRGVADRLCRLATEAAG